MFIPQDHLYMFAHDLGINIVAMPSFDHCGNTIPTMSSTAILQE